jgi:hypothetical protein
MFRLPVDVSGPILIAPNFSQQFCCRLEASLGTAQTLLVEDTVPEANGDFDADGDIDGQDLLLWQRGRSPRPYSMIDLTQSNGRFGTAAPSGGVPAPEPGEAAIALPAITVVLAMRRRASRSALSARVS